MIVKSHHPLDIHIGKRLRLRRKMVGLSQAALGKQTGVTFQQIQKYESGVNSINAHRLYDLAAVLGMTVAYFYEGYGSEEQPVEPEGWSAQGIHLMQDYYSISCAKVKQTVAALVREIAKENRRGL